MPASSRTIPAIRWAVIGVSVSPSTPRRSSTTDAVSWPVIVMLCGIVTYVELLNRTGTIKATGEFLAGTPFVHVNWIDGFDAKGNPVGRPVRMPYIPLLAVTVGIVALLLCMVVAILWFDRDGLADHHRGARLVRKYTARPFRRG